MSYRTTVLEKDRAGYTLLEATEYGAFVVKARRGQVYPILCQDEDDAIALLGKPNSSYPEIAEILEYVKTAPAWVCSPFYADALYGGIAVKGDGVYALTKGISDITNVDFTEFPVKQLIGTGDNSTKTFNKTLSNLAYVDLSLITLILKTSAGVETEYTITPSDATTEILTDTVLDTGSQLVRSSGALTLVFINEVATDTEIYVEYKYVCTDIRFLIVPISPCSTWLGAKIVSKEAGTNGIYIIDLAEVDADSNYYYLDQYEFSLTETKKNASGKPVYIEKIFDENIYVTYVINSAYAGVVTAITAESSYTDLEAGVRGTDITATERNVSWDYFKRKRTYPVDLIVETSGESSCVTKIVDLVTIYQQYKAFGIIALPFGEASASALITAKDNLSVNTDQLTFYCNWGKIENPYLSGTYFWTSLVGRDARNMAKMANVYNSLSPAGTYENDLGGELGTGIKELEFDFTDAELLALDNAEINPHTYNYNKGYLASGDRTALTSLTDTSFIGTRRLLNLIIYNTVEDILTDQEFKNNDSFKRRLFEQKFAIMAEPILIGDSTHPDGFCSYLEGIADNDKVNTTAILQQRKFKALIVFQATPNSQRVILEVIRMPQGEVSIASIT